MIAKDDPVFLRQSVRRYTSEPVSEEDVEDLLKAAMQAPSAGNQQPWEFWAVTDAAVRGKLSKASPYAGPAAGAPLVFVLCANEARLRFPENWEHDMGAAAATLLIEAAGKGLGAVWMGLAPLEERMAAARKALGLGDDILPFCLIACGHPDGGHEPHLRYDPARVHWVP